MMDKATPADFLAGAKASDGRPRFEVPDAAAPLTPVMRLLDEQLLTDEEEPPMRRAIDGWPVEVRASEPMGMHELTAAGANSEEQVDDCLPPPKFHSLAAHDQYTMALMIERYVDFFKRVKSKKNPLAEIEKRLPAPFVAHYLRYRASCLPCVGALATMPLVLPNGTLLAANGLDRKRKTVFRIEPGILDLMPSLPLIGAEVAEAINFLVNDWLTDVQTDFAGKCVIVALALTIIERDLLGERPAFFLTAGKRGGGKTTTMNMISLALTGKRAPAVAWSNSEEERRKAIFAAALQATPFIVFDNIAAGSTISSPTIEKTLTASEITDRVLGESRNDSPVCSFIPVFTGNNIAAKGDLASRALEARLNVDRPDPENRDFTHPDPFGWTLEHRGEIVTALYTILLANPRLKGKIAAEKTRFKQWHRLVGSAVEHAAEMAGIGAVDFGKLFLAVEEQDVETMGLAETLQYLDGRAEGKPFKSADVLKWANEDDDDARSLRDFLGGSAARPLTAAWIAKKLNGHKDAPIKVGAAVWTLTSTAATGGNITQFGIDKKEKKA